MNHAHLMPTPEQARTINHHVYPESSGQGYYVTAIDAGRVALAAGPYDYHHHALDAVAVARARSEAIDPRAVFYAFGTSLMPTRKLGVLGVVWGQR